MFGSVLKTVPTYFDRRSYAIIEIGWPMFLGTKPSARYLKFKLCQGGVQEGILKLAQRNPTRQSEPVRASQSQSEPVGASRSLQKVQKFFFLCWLNFKYFEGFEVWLF